MDNMWSNVLQLKIGLKLNKGYHMTYNSKQIMQELMDAVSEVYRETGQLKLTAEEFSMSPLKIRKLLITAGAYSSDLSDEVCELYREGKSIREIEEITGLKKSSINGYLPYTKVVYKPKELSMNAKRIVLYRDRKKAVSVLCKEMREQALWDAVVLFQEYPFYTASGLPFSYVLKKGRDGSYNKELIVNRRKDSKTLAWSSILLAFKNAKDLKGEVVLRPKALGDIRGISYVYPMLYRFGVIEVPEKTAVKMKHYDIGAQDDERTGIGVV